MEKQDAIIKYRGTTDIRIIAGYSDAQKEIMYNYGDPDMKPIVLTLPRPPDWDLIEGFGLAPKDQYFTLEKYPEKLKDLEYEVVKELKVEYEANKNNRITVQKKIDKMWKKIEDNRKYFREEVKWIKKQWWYRMNHYWCFIDGAPTLIDGWHWFSLNYWDMEGKKPDYRDRDRRKFLFWKYTYTATETYRDIDDKGEAYPDEDGYYRVVDTGKRVFMGNVYPKHRRDGATHNSLTIGYELITRHMNKRMGIQSFDETNAEKHYEEKFVNAWKEMPFFFKPMWRGTDSPQKGMDFENPQGRYGDELRSYVDYATTASRNYYDGGSLLYLLADEEGKTVREDVVGRWNRLKHTVSEGNGSYIHGFSMHPSTTGDMEHGGGDRYQKLCDGSDFYKRDRISGQTPTGLNRLFLPGDDGLVEYIDAYGMSVIKKPSKIQSLFINKKNGSHEYLMSERSRLLSLGDPDSMRDYYDLLRNFPLYYADSFRVVGGDTGFDVEMIDQAYNRLVRDFAATGRGNFMWIVEGFGNPMSAKEYISLGLHMDTSIDGFVEFFPDKRGRFKVSHKPHPSMTNLKFKENGVWMPQYPTRYTASADPFQFLKNAESKISEDRARLSKGGGAVFWERDETIDPPTKDIDKWESHRFCCTYSSRTDDDDEYAEEMLMMSVFYGCEAYPERNVKLILKHFEKRGYGGFLKYAYNPVTQKFADSAGFHSLEESKQELFNSIKSYIKWHFHREQHIDLVVECKKIRGIEHMKFFDLFTACGGCLLGSKHSMKEVRGYEGLGGVEDDSVNEDTDDLNDYLQTFKVEY